MILFDTVTIHATITFVRLMSDDMSASELGRNIGVAFAPNTHAQQERSTHPLVSPDRIAIPVGELAPAFATYPFTFDIVSSLHDHHPATYNHSLRTGIGLARLAQELNFSEEDSALLVASGLVHDGGKTAIDVGVLDLKGELGEKRQEMERHLEAGVQLIPEGQVRTVVAGHHIADGYTQYSHLWQTGDRKLQQFQLLLSALERTDAVMTNERVYRTPASAEEALTMLLMKGFDTRFREVDLDPHLLGRIVKIQESVLQNPLESYFS